MSQLLPTLLSTGFLRWTETTGRSDGGSAGPVPKRGEAATGVRATRTVARAPQRGASYCNAAAASLTVAKVTGVIRDRPSRYASTEAYKRSTSAAVAAKGLRPGVRLGLC